MATVNLQDYAPAAPGAVAYACTRLGLRVFPLVPGIGTPALKRWQHQATLDESTVRLWWTGEYAGYGVGVATGAESGVWVLDIDRKHGVDGFATLRDLFAENNQSSDIFTQTMCVATPSGGAHLYFRWNPAEDAIPNSTGGTNQLGRGLDVRGTHGYVRAPEVNGYRIVPRDGVKRTQIVAAPAWLTALTRKPEPRGQLSAEPVDAQTARRLSARALDTLAHAETGTQNPTLNRTAFLLALNGVATEDEAWTRCQDILIGMGAGDGMERWRRTFESGWRAGVAKRVIA